MKNKIIIIYLIFFFVLSGSALAGFFGPKDKQPPVIDLTDYKLADNDIPHIVFMEKIVVQGQIEDENNIESLALNQMPLRVQKGNNIFFSHITELNMGKNVLTIEAVDKAGNSAVKTIHITRKLPAQIQMSERLSLAVLPFKYEKNVSNETQGFCDSLTNALAKRNRFQMIERNQMDIIIQEQHLNRSRLFDTKTASKLGRLALARSVITGSIVNTHDRVVIRAEMIDVETSEIISRQEILGDLNDPLLFKDMAEGLALKFHQDFPLIDGRIIEKQGQNIVVDLGQNGIKPGRRLIIFKEEPVIHPVTGKSVGADIQILGLAMVIKVLKKTATARLKDGDEKMINRLDRVITE